MPIRKDAATAPPPAPGVPAAPAVGGARTFEEMEALAVAAAAATPHPDPLPPLRDAARGGSSGQGERGAASERRSPAPTAES